ncbi:MAG TPA: hypothetical protein VMH28_24100 [Candidatus Acidoferrales bacterium]|nr:hypothetical protein [Candidatus Acidoferrales bacterium]
MRTRLLLGASALLAMSAIAIPGAAQTPQMARVTVTHVKPDMLNEWLDLEKNEVVPALKKAGQASRTVYATSLFGNAYEYVIITPFARYAEFDAGNPMTKALGQPAAARLGEKLRKCTLSNTSYSITRLTDLSNVLEDAMPQMIVTARYRITPGKIEEYRNLVKSEVLPVYKKAKTGLIVNQRGPGANPNEVTMSTVLTKFADLDGGPLMVKQLGQAGADRVNAKFIGVRTLIEVVVRARVPDLSF